MAQPGLWPKSQCLSMSRAHLARGEPANANYTDWQHVSEQGAKSIHGFAIGLASILNKPLATLGQRAEQVPIIMGLDRREVGHSQVLPRHPSIGPPRVEDATGGLQYVPRAHPPGAC